MLTWPERRCNTTRAMVRRCRSKNCFGLIAGIFSDEQRLSYKRPHPKTDLNDHVSHTSGHVRFSRCSRRLLHVCKASHKTAMLLADYWPCAVTTLNNSLVQYSEVIKFVNNQLTRCGHPISRCITRYFNGPRNELPAALWPYSSVNGANASWDGGSTVTVVTSTSEGLGKYV